MSTKADQGSKGRQAIQYKMVVLGPGGVGKSALTIMFVNHKFTVDYDPTIEDNYRKIMVIDGETCMLDILDTAGQEEFAGLRDQYIRFGDGFLLVADVTNRLSFDEVLKLRKHIIRVKEKDKMPMIIAGNKIDLEDQRQVTSSEGEALAKSLSCKYFETSAKQYVMVENLFFNLVREMRVIRKPPPKTKGPCALL